MSFITRHDFHKSIAKNVYISFFILIGNELEGLEIKINKRCDIPGDHHSRPGIVDLNLQIMHIAQTVLH